MILTFLERLHAMPKVDRPGHHSCADGEVTQYAPTELAGQFGIRSFAARLTQSILFLTTSVVGRDRGVPRRCAMERRSRAGQVAFVIVLFSDTLTAETAKWDSAGDPNNRL